MHGGDRPSCNDSVCINLFNKNKNYLFTELANLTNNLPETFVLIKKWLPMWPMFLERGPVAEIPRAPLVSWLNCWSNGCFRQDPATSAADSPGQGQTLAGACSCLGRHSPFVVALMMESSCRSVSGFFVVVEVLITIGIVELEKGEG